jgi:hypothetical protein
LTFRAIWCIYNREDAIKGLRKIILLSKGDIKWLRAIH